MHFVTQRMHVNVFVSNLSTFLLSFFSTCADVKSTISMEVRIVLCMSVPGNSQCHNFQHFNKRFCWPVIALLRHSEYQSSGRTMKTCMQRRSSATAAAHEASVAHTPCKWWPQHHLSSTIVSCQT